MNKENINEIILQLAEKLDNSLFMATGPMAKAIPATTHVQGLVGTMQEVKRELHELSDRLES